MYGNEFTPKSCDQFVTKMGTKPVKTGEIESSNFGAIKIKKIDGKCCFPSIFNCPPAYRAWAFLSLVRMPISPPGHPYKNFLRFPGQCRFLLKNGIRKRPPPGHVNVKDNRLGRILFPCRPFSFCPKNSWSE